MNYFKIFFSILQIALVVYAGITFIIYLMQEKFIFFPEKLPSGHTFDFPVPFEEKFYMVKEDIKIHAIHFKTENPKGIFLYLHGNTGALDRWGYAALPLVKMGYEVIMPDYRGYGKSTGKLRSELDLYHDAEFIYKEMKKNFDVKNILLYGRSLGTGPATWLAARYHFQKILLETPYYSIEEMAKNQMGFLPVRLLLKYHLKNHIYIPEINNPVFIIHGTEDELIPYEHSVRLSKLLSNPDHFFTVPNGTHNDLERFPEFQGFLNRVLGD